MIDVWLMGSITISLYETQSICRLLYTLTGSASLFIVTHPEHDPKICADEIADRIFTQNTVIILGEQLKEQAAILKSAHTFVKEVVACHMTVRSMQYSPDT
jgi:hypothetical protein